MRPQPSTNVVPVEAPGALATSRRHVLLVYAAVGASKVMKSAKAFVLGVMKSAVAVRATHVDLRKQSDRHLACAVYRANAR